MGSESERANGIRSIPTQYGGTRFRSRLEASTAYVLDQAGVAWKYESEGFDLGAAVWYLPDFYLPDARQFVEVKGVLDGDAWEKPLALCEASADRKLSIVVLDDARPNYDGRLYATALLWLRLGFGAAEATGRVHSTESYLAACECGITSFCATMSSSHPSLLSCPVCGRQGATAVSITKWQLPLYGADRSTHPPDAGDSLK